MINIAYCKSISDHSLMSLSKCPKLKIIESRGCPLITSSGLAAIAVGCKQVTKLDIKKCHNIDDAAMIPLAHFSQNLKQVLSIIPCFRSLINSFLDYRNIKSNNIYFLINQNADKFVVYLSDRRRALVPCKYQLSTEHDGPSPERLEPEWTSCCTLSMWWTNKG